MQKRELREKDLQTGLLRDDRCTLGLAVSGGGYRSALFSLGVLYYLARSEKIGRLRTITSVSGGSYTNAQAFLYGEDLREASEDAFVRHFRGFVGAFVDKSPWRRFSVWGSIVLILAGLVVAVVGIRPVDWYWRVIAAVVVLFAIPRFGKILARAIWKILFEDVPSKARLASPEPDGAIRLVRTTKGGLQRAKTMERVEEVEPLDTVHHVFCATDLHYLRFLYFTNRLVYNRRLRHAHPSEFTLRQAVDASAAIPPIFAPVVVDTEPFRMRPPDAPRKLLTVDGGVHDTLATEWYRIAPTIPARPAPSGQPRGGPVEVPDVVLVVDGSSPIRPRDYVPKTTFWVVRSRMPVLWWVMSHVRSAFAAFSNWDRRNFRRLRQTRRIPTADSASEPQPSQVPEAARAPGKPPKGSLVAVTIQEFPLQLAEAAHRTRLRRDRIDWRDVVRGNAEVPTWPTSLERARAAKLLFHGYATAWTVFTDPDAIQAGLEEHEDLPTLEWLERRWFS